jgi:acyl carrier protein
LRLPDRREDDEGRPTGTAEGSVTPEADEIAAKVLDILIEEFGDCTLADNLYQTFALDSLDRVHLTIALEAEFDLEIPDDDTIDPWKTGQEIVDYLFRRGQAVTGV